MVSNWSESEGEIYLFIKTSKHRLKHWERGKTKQLKNKIKLTSDLFSQPIEIRNFKKTTLESKPIN